MKVIRPVSDLRNNFAGISSSRDVLKSVKATAGGEHTGKDG